MAQSASIWYPTQHSFAGGEVSERLSVRQDTDVYRQSTLRLVNMFPTLQGSLERAPGFTFLSEAPGIKQGEEGRITSFIDLAENRVLAIFAPGKLTIQTNILADPAGSTGPNPTAGVSGRINVIQNYDFRLGSRYWTQRTATVNTPFDVPEEYRPFLFFIQGESRSYLSIYRVAAWPSPARDWGVLNQTWVKQRVTVEQPTSSATLRYNGRVESLNRLTEYSADEHQFQVRFTVSLPDNTVVFQHTDYYNFPMERNEVKTFDRALVFAPPTDFIGDLIVTIEPTQDYQNKPEPDGGEKYAVWWMNFQFDEITLEVAGAPPPPSTELIGPWQSDEMQALQFVQSPYDPFPLVVVHPNWPPRKVYLDIGSGQYVVEELIPGTSDGANPNWPDDWAPGAFPASCTAYQGRLMLGGHGPTSQKVWGSESGNWENFTLPTTDPVPTDPIMFETTFRSQIQWMAGHKQLLIGTTDLEYSVVAESGVLATGDIDARVNSGHGSANVQPVAYGDEIIFASEKGTRVRAAGRNFDRVGWEAKDLNVLAPHITASGIVRMTRVRSPHAMLLCVLEDGTLAVLHYDHDLQFHGWSRIEVSGTVRDICTLTDERGQDVPYALIERNIAGAKKTYLEGIVRLNSRTLHNFYMDSNKFYSSVTSHVLTGLGHLEDLSVQVVTENGYVGEYIVNNGSITVVDNDGDPIAFTQAAVGIKQPCSVTTLPPAVSDMSGGYIGNLRYSTVLARVRNSTAPMINGIRPPDRYPAVALDTVEVVPGVSDVKVANVGWDAFASITLSEDTPMRFELAALSYKLASKVL